MILDPQGRGQTRFQHISLPHFSHVQCVPYVFAHAVICGLSHACCHGTRAVICMPPSVCCALLSGFASVPPYLCCHVCVFCSTCSHMRALLYVLLSVCVCVFILFSHMCALRCALRYVLSPGVRFHMCCCRVIIFQSKEPPKVLSVGWSSPSFLPQATVLSLQWGGVAASDDPPNQAHLAMWHLHEMCLAHT